MKMKYKGARTGPPYFFFFYNANILYIDSYIINVKQNQSNQTVVKGV